VDVPLAATFMLFTKEGKEAYVEPVIEGARYQFTVELLSDCFHFQAAVRFYTLNLARVSTREGWPEFAGWRREPIPNDSVERSTVVRAKPRARLQGSFRRSLQTLLVPAVCLYPTSRVFAGRRGRPGPRFFPSSG
jgi:hypothetical protein